MDTFRFAVYYLRQNGRLGIYFGIMIMIILVTVVVVRIIVVVVIIIICECPPSCDVFSPIFPVIDMFPRRRKKEARTKTITRCGKIGFPLVTIK
jgi:hypothetical protein